MEQSVLANPIIRESEQDHAVSILPTVDGNTNAAEAETRNNMIDLNAHSPNNQMKNPLKKLFKDRGVPDSHVHPGNSSSSASSAIILSSVPPPVGYPYNKHYDPYISVSQPATAYTHAPQQDVEDSEQSWEINAGNNRNMKGNQKAGSVRAGNSAAGSTPAINLPSKGKFVFNAGGNCNYGDSQEGGNVEFGNVG